jgi:beta-glucanase (GH16 family)
MKHFFRYGTFLLLFFISTFQLQAQSGEFEALVWADEFNEGSRPNEADWTYEQGNGCPSNCGWGNNEEQYYTDKTQNVRIENGILIIEARKEDNKITSGRIITQGKRSFKYGRIEVRAKLPSGRGTWPAIWMLGENINTVGWPACGEIDIMEYVGYEPQKVHGSLHTPSSYGNTQNTSEITVSNAESAFNLYAIEWDEEKIRFFVNDTNFYTYQPAKSSSTWPFDQQAFLILNLAIGGNWGGAQGVDESIFPQRFEIDYVRVYQKFSGEVSLTAPQYVQPFQQNVQVSATELVGATYEWILPEGVTVSQGQGTANIQLNWGDTSGEVKVKVMHNGQLYEATKEIKVKVDPQSAYAFPIKAENWSIPEEFNSNFQIEDQPQGTQFTFNVDQPEKNPYVLLNLPQPVNMQAYHKMSVKLKSTEAPETLRMDLLDIDGQATASEEVFKLHPLNTDGQWHNYVHYFEPIFEASTLDRSAIHQLKMYVNYSWLAAVASGSFTIESMVIDTAETNLIPASPLAFAKETQESTTNLLTWADSANNEKGYRIYRQSTDQQEAELVAELPVDTEYFEESAQLKAGTYSYFLSAFNQFGETEPLETKVNIVKVLSTSDELSDKNFKISPNPATDKLKIQGIDKAKVSIFSMKGTLLREFEINGASEISIVDLPSGLYLIRLQTADSLSLQKVFKI